MRRKLLAVTLALALVAALGTAVYANHEAPSQVADVTLHSKSFVIDGHTYGGVKGGVTVSGAAGSYKWTITNNDKKRHTFEVEYETETGDVHLTLNEAGDKILNFPKGSGPTTATFTLESGKTYKVYCTLHEKAGMFFYLVTP